MLRKWQTFGPVVVVLLLTSLVMWPVPAQDAQSDGQSNVTPTAGAFAYKGGPAKGKVARTDTKETKFDAAAWKSLPGATLSWFAPTTTDQGDLFNVAFSAECRVRGSGDDYVRIRILDNGVPMEPYDGDQGFCSAPGPATHKGNWVKRVRPGNHTLIVQFWVVDNPPMTGAAAAIDDWTFELVVYD